MTPSPIADEGARAMFVMACTVAVLALIALGYYLDETVRRWVERRRQAEAAARLFEQLGLHTLPNEPMYDR